VWGVWRWWKDATFADFIVQRLVLAGER